MEGEGDLSCMQEVTKNIPIAVGTDARRTQRKMSVSETKKKKRRDDITQYACPFYSYPKLHAFDKRDRNIVGRWFTFFVEGRLRKVM